MVAVVFLVAGVLLAASGRAARGTDLRGGRRVGLAELVRQEQRTLARKASELQKLQADVDARTREAAQRNSRVAAAQNSGARVAAAAGLQPLTGPGIVVTLDDAPRLPKGEVRRGNPTPDDLVVHQQDVQGVVNALWAGGADAMTIMGKRVITSTSVQCVGNTLFFQDAVYSPPFVIAAVGDAAAMSKALDAERSVQLFRQAVAAWGLGLGIERKDAIAVPAYDGPLALQHARRVGAAQ
jgi:uncharacterized protein YlxW (UPF0749 family)